MLNRDQSLRQIEEHTQPWDMAVIGGGATGVGVAVDAASRGYSVVLLEQSDFGKGTSSRSTKLVHGGVRYLQQGNVALVLEALRERELLRQNAPHLVHDLPFIVPNYQWWEAPFYGIGLKVYDLLARDNGFGRSKLLSQSEVLQHIPTLERDGLRGGVRYHDGQFDDSRLLINLAQTAAEQGACLLNYARVISLTKNSAGRVTGLVVRDEESQGEHHVAARCVVNATGPFCDELRRLDEAHASRLVAPSQGAHVVLPKEFLPGETAIMVPHTRDGRVMFAIPWHGHTVVGTTDTALQSASLDPVPLAEEINFILETAGRYLARDPAHADVLSVFAGIRPLVKADGETNTAVLSRDHFIQVSRSGLISITGGKWTTYRRMAEDCVDRAIEAGLPAKKKCVTSSLPVHGASTPPSSEALFGEYGSDASKLLELTRERPDLAEPLHHHLSICGAHVIWSVRNEMARTVEDVLARRTRALFLNARAAAEMAPSVAQLLADELHRPADWTGSQLREFQDRAKEFLAVPPD